MTPSTQVEPLVDPKELASFEEAEGRISKARSIADSIPAELDDDSSSSASDALKEVRHAREDVEVSAKAEKAPYKVTGDVILANFNELLSPLKAIELSLKERIVKYDAKVQAAARAEQKRIEDNAHRRQEREDKKAAEENRASHDKRGAPAPPPPPKGARGSFAKTTVKEVLKYAIEDETKLPDHLVKRVPDKAKIKAAVNAGEAIPGVRVWKEPEVATR